MNKQNNYSSALQDMYRNLLDTKAMAVQNMENMVAMLEKYRKCEARFQAVITFQNR